MTAVLRAIVEIFVAGFSGIVASVDRGLTKFAQTLFLGPEPGTLFMFSGLMKKKKKLEKKNNEKEDKE